MVLLEIENIAKNFGGINALKGVSLQLKKGEILGLVGPNGAGKTTLVNIISGLIPPDKGRIIFQEEDITNLSPEDRARKGIMRSFQGGRVFWYLPVAWNILASASSIFKDWEAIASASFAMTLTGISYLARRIPTEKHIDIESIKQNSAVGRNV